MGDSSDSDSDGGSTSASEDEGVEDRQGGAAARRPGRATSTKAKAAVLEMLQGARPAVALVVLDPLSAEDAVCLYDGPKGAQDRNLVHTSKKLPIGRSEPTYLPWGDVAGQWRGGGHRSEGKILSAIVFCRNRCGLVSQNTHFRLYRLEVNCPSLHVKALQLKPRALLVEREGHILTSHVKWRGTGDARKPTARLESPAMKVCTAKQAENARF